MYKQTRNNLNHTLSDELPSDNVEEYSQNISDQRKQISSDSSTLSIIPPGEIFIIKCEQDINGKSLNFRINVKENEEKEKLLRLNRRSRGEIQPTPHTKSEL